MTIYIDADACPVTRIAERVAKERGIPVVLLCDTNVWTETASCVRICGDAAVGHLADAADSREWTAPEYLRVELIGLDLDVVWANIVAGVAGVELRQGQSLNGQPASRQKREKLQEEIAGLEKLAWTEKQPGRKMEFATRMHRLSKELESLKQKGRFIAMSEEKTLILEIPPEETWQTVRGYVVDALRQVYSAVNSAMVPACWSIGRSMRFAVKMTAPPTASWCA